MNKIWGRIVENKAASERAALLQSQNGKKTCFWFKREN